jgi:hypothetical protein
MLNPYPYQKMNQDKKNCFVNRYKRLVKYKFSQLRFIYLFSDCEEWQRWTPTVLTGRSSTCSARDEPSGIACSIRQVVPVPVPSTGGGRTKRIELNGAKHSSDSVADLRHLDADPDPACHFDVDQDPACPNEK